MAKRKIVCFGPGPKFKGGISNYNTSLAKALDKFEDVEVHIVSWTQQYPAIIPREFVDKSSKTDLLDNTNIKVKYITNYNNPFTWKETYNYILSLNAEKVIFQWSIAVQGLPLGWLAKKLKKHAKIEVLFDLHFVIQKENSKIDQLFTKIGINNADNYIVHAYKTFNELKEVFPKKELSVNESGERKSKNGNTVVKLFHPIYELFSPNPEFDVASFKKEHGLKEHVFLFFGFIRKYKGLHHLIKAFKKVSEQRDDVSLLICGESFWATLDNSKFTTKLKNLTFGLVKILFLKKADDEREYRPLELIEKLNLQEQTMVVNKFIPNEEVSQYFQVSDAVVLYYEYATPSGIESLSYNFKLPILATKVGHFPETIEDGFNGYLAEAEDIDSMAEQMIKFLNKPLPKENVSSKTKELSWENYAKAILKSA
jgi:glycosyltransferase involved in cell wall biosynthesis